MTIAELIDLVEKKAPPAPAEELAAFESELGAVLPDDYRSFLIATNGGYLGGRLWFFGPTPDGNAADAGIHHIGGFRKEWHFSLTEHRDCYEGRIPHGLLCVADDPFGNAICIGLADQHRGRIYFWDHEAEPDSEGWDGQVQTAGNVTLLANSFSEFVSELKPSEE
jgi:cell wall assembly regulator SMI1